MRRGGGARRRPEGRQERGGGGRGGRRQDDAGDRRNNGRRHRDQPNDDDDDVVDLDGAPVQPARKLSRFRIGWNKLIELKNADAKETCVYLNGNKKVYMEDVLKKELYKDKPDWIPLVLSISLKICNASPAMPQSVIEYLTTLANSEFIQKNMGMHLMNMTMEKSVDRQEKNKDTLILAIRLFKELLTRVPSQSFQAMFAMSAMLGHILTFLRMNSNIVDDEIESGVDQVKQMVEDLHKREAEVVSEGLNKCRVSNQQSDAPPEDFRTLSLIPQPKDLDLYEKPFLRPNLARGCYDDINHYLDVNFRLLREDFVRPLREGINDYLNPKKNRRQQHIRIYENVQILNPVCGSSGLNYKLRFNPDRYKNVKWESSKRLMYGSLVCLSIDRFKTIIFGTVSHRDVNDLKKGEIEVRFEEFHDEVTKALRNPDYIYTMVETSAYYEAYRHVLLGLQNIEILPFEKHIVKCEPLIKPPRYMNQNTEYDLTPLLAEDYSAAMVSMYTGKYHVKPLDDRAWPLPEKIGLDHSQCDALKLALTKEIAIIQGPPGTGKTYIGLELVKVLLNNANVWRHNVENEDIQHPILIVCYTNHALDQFLEGIQKFHDKNIVRVGGRCNTPSLEKFLLKNLKHRLRENKEIPRAVFAGQQQVVEDMRALEDEIADTAKRIALVEEGIIHENVLENCMPPILFEQLVDGPYRDVGLDGCMMKEWLGYGVVPIRDHARDVEEMEVDEDQVVDDEEEGIDIDDEANMLERQRIIDELKTEDYFPVQEKHVERTVDTSILGMKIDDIQPERNANEWQQQGKSKSQMRRHLKRQLRSSDVMPDDDVHRVRDIWRMSIEDRWRLYRSFVKKYIEKSNTVSNELQLKYSQAAERMREITSRTDLMILQNAMIIGMTTTGAARCQKLLQEIKPKIVIVEEAAEVLESHIITALSDGCEHLVLIGDHKQLRPSATVYQLAKKYNLEISFFERMINNDVEYKCLSFQHRMRPSIASMMSFIYPELQNHAVVETYEKVEGIVPDVFFINHKHQEETESELISHFSVHEADYISRLCRYLMMQGYKSNQITVLTPYSGQLHQLKRFMPKREFGGVRVTLVDNYQGEENDIILLSLVRSNKSGSIGFLKIENRVCVALSRAKKGLYVIGNIDHLALHSELWSKIYNHAKKERICGQALELCCQNHPANEHIMAKDPNDFSKAPEGGCMEPCDFRLQCGHQCLLPCHVKDREHSNYICRKPCQKVVCDRGHKCTGTCADTQCKPCKKMVEKELPCGHKQNAECYLSPEFVRCTKLCDKKLACGHKCMKFCSQPCLDAKQCIEKVGKIWPCGHKFRVPCNTDVFVTACGSRCKTVLMCDHPCAGTCGTCWQGRIHMPCKSKCQRSLVCGHFCQVDCTKNCPPCKKKCRNRCMHSKCQEVCGSKCVPCNEKCAWSCKHYKCTKLCHEMCNRPVCNEPCTKLLRCYHPCIGLCGEQCPKLCRVCNREEVQEILFGSEDEPDARFVQLEDCGHVVEVSGLDHWIEQGGSNDANNQQAVQLPTCPKCKTPIQQHLRYGDVVKGRVAQIERVKEKILGENERKNQNVKRLLGELNTIVFYKLSTRESLKEILHGKLISLNQINAIENQFNIMKALNKMTKQVKENLKSSPKVVVSIVKKLQLIEEKILSIDDRISDQQLEDFSIETTRCQLFVCFSELLQKKKALSMKLESKMEEDIVKVEKILTSEMRISEVEENEISRFLKELKAKIPTSGLGISNEERIQIVKAMDLTQGHWFTCPKGHIYAIGECGGANQRGTCPECGSAIGGMNHALTTGNRHTGLMDNSRYAAWSDQANLENFNLDDLH